MVRGDGTSGGRTVSSARNRRFRDVAFALGCLLALATIAVLLPALGSPAALGDAGVEGDDLGIEGDVADGLGGSESSPLDGGDGGIGAEDETDAGSPENPFQNRSDEIRFTVDSERASYWRVDAYDRFTGDSWERTGGERAYEGVTRPEGRVDDTVTQRVRLEAPATALPAAWQPARVEVDGAAELAVSTEGGIHAEEGVPAGTEYTVESYRYAPDPDALRAAGENYPDGVEERYTALPADTPQRVHDLAAEITADAETPYDRADEIDAWIEENKEYSLDAEHDPDSRPVDQFLFEMDAGYCQYAASSMVVLLRSQDVPARYVTGYSPGTVSDDGSYEVRSMNAHAWVEVYFPEHGWVRFDPTPAEERIDREREDLDDQGTDDPVAYAPSVNDEPDDLEEEYHDGTVAEPDGWEPREDGWAPDGTDEDGDEPSDGPDEPGDEFEEGPTDERDGEMESDGERDDEPDERDETDERDDAEEDERDESDGDESDERDDPEEDEVETDAGYAYEISLSPEEPIPGTEATATVTRRDLETDETEPIAGAEVSFNGDPVGTTDESGAVTGEVPFEESLEVTVALPDEESSLERSRSLSALGSGAGAAPLASRHSTTEDPSETYPVASDVRIDADPTPVVAGGEATVHVSIRGTPVPDATVELGDDAVGTTDGDGRLEVDVPDAGGETLVLSARRGGLSGEENLSVRELSIEADHEYGIPLPGRKTTFTVTAGNDTLAGVELERDGETVGATDGNGTATAALPFANSAVYATEYAGARADVAVDRILLYGAGVAAAGVGLLVGAVVGARRAGLTRRRIVTAVRSAVIAAVNAVVLAAERIDALADLLVDRLRGGVASIRTLPARLYDRWLDWRPGSFAAAIVGALSALLAGLWPRNDAGTGLEAGSGADSSSTASGGQGRVRATVRSAWSEFVRMVLPRRYRTKTPGEIARRAVEMGLPERPVYALTNAFRDVEYGGETTDGRADEANEALETLRESTEGEDR